MAKRSSQDKYSSPNSTVTLKLFLEKSIRLDSLINVKNFLERGF